MYFTFAQPCTLTYYNRCSGPMVKTCYKILKVFFCVALFNAHSCVAFFPSAARAVLICIWNRLSCTLWGLIERNDTKRHKNLLGTLKVDSLVLRFFYFAAIFPLLTFLSYIFRRSSFYRGFFMRSCCRHGYIFSLLIVF